MNPHAYVRPVRAALFAAALAVGTNAFADAVTDWNQKVCDVAVDARLGTPPSLRTMATAQTAVYVATSSFAITGSGSPFGANSPAQMSNSASG